MKYRRVCGEKGCDKNLFTQNKSGYCNWHNRKHSEKYRKTQKKYAEKRGKKLVVCYTKSLSILKEKHLEEFNEIYNNLKEKLN